ncbi:MAG: hypothetical protein JSR91_15145 [Proteobacteria bacterium]|nr:hypothetical protein [Pseudomonadota bacterium]
MMVLVRALGWVLLAMAVAAIVHDCLAWWSEGSFHMMLLGDLWSRFNYTELRPAAGSPPPGGLWHNFVLPLLATPALPVFTAAGVILLWIGRRIGSRTEERFLTGSRPPRRRSSLS